MTHRTLADACAIKDRSNSTLRFPRTMKQAGILGPLAPVEDDHFGKWCAAVCGSIIAGAVVYVLLVCLFSVTA